MSISITSGVMIPVSVVEVGNEITQDQLNAITAATLPSVGNVFITQSLLTSSLTPYAFIASPTFTGTPTLPTGTIGVTQSTADNSTKLATTAFVKAQSYLTTTTAASTYQTISGMTSYAPKASPTFTGTVTIPAGASISGYLTTSSASSTYQTISGMSSYATQSYVTSQGYLTDAPSNGNEYVRKNGAWAIATGGGGGGGISEAPNDGYSYVRQMSGWIQVGANAYDTVTTQQWVNSQGFAYASSIPTLSVTNIDLTGNFNGYSMGSGYYSFKYDSTANTLRIQDGVGFGTTVSTRGIDESVSTISTSTTLDATHSNVLNVVASYYTISIPQDSTYTFPIGKRFFICSPAGSIVDASMTSVVLNGATGGSYTLTLGVNVLIKVAADTWYIS